MPIRPLAVALVGTAALLTGFGAAAQSVGKASDPARDVGRAAPGQDNSYFNVTAKNRIPAPLLPLKSGQCVIWYPEKGVAEHTGPMPCKPLPKVEPGGWLIAPSKDPVILEAAVYHAENPGVVIARGAFDARTRYLVRTLDPDSKMDIEKGKAKR